VERFMDIEFKSEEGCRKSYTVTAPWEEVQPRFASVVRSLRGQIRLPGFRPGKAPDSVVLSRFKKEIREEVLEHLLEDTAKALVDKFSLKPVVEPYATRIHLEEGETFSCEIHAEEAPDVPPLDAKGVVVEIPRIDVSNEQVEKAVESLRERAAVMKPVEKAEEGDYAVVNVQRKGQAKGLERLFRAQGDHGLPEEKALLGRTAGETFDLAVAEGAEEGHDHAHGAGESGHQHLAPGEYVITVNRLMRREVPALNDELAKDLGADSLQDLRSRVRQDIEARVQAEMRAVQEDRVIEALLARSPFPVPPTLVERQLRSDLEDLAEGLARQGLDLERSGLDWEKMAESRRPLAQRKVGTYYLLSSVARGNGLQAADAEVDAYFEQKAAGTKATAQQLRAHAEKEGQLDMVKTLITHKKALDLLLSQASVTFTEGKAATPEAPDGSHPDRGGADEPR
jgi:trigger factor